MKIKKITCLVLAVVLLAATNSALAASPDESILVQPALSVRPGSAYEMRIDEGIQYAIGTAFRESISLSALLDEFEVSANGQLIPCNSNGEPIEATAEAKTGQILVVLDQEGLETDTAILVFRGDILGNGKVSITDLVQLSKAFSGENELEGPYLLAGDMNDSGKIDLGDLVIMAKAVSGNGPESPEPTASPVLTREPSATPTPLSDTVFTPVPSSEPSPAASGTASSTELPNTTPMPSSEPTSEEGNVHPNETEYTQAQAKIVVDGVDEENAEEVTVSVWLEDKESTKKTYVAKREGDVWQLHFRWTSAFTTPGTYCIEAHLKDKQGETSSLGLAKVEVTKSAFAGNQIMGKSFATVEQLVNMQLNHYSWNNTWYGMTVLEFCQMYYDICQQEGVRVEVAYAQMIHETGGLRYTGLVVRDQHNFAGMGSSGAIVSPSKRHENHRYTADGKDAGLIFTTVENGIKSHIQHLKGYATKEPLVLEMAPEYDRYGAGGIGIAPYVEDLGKTWAQSSRYGNTVLQFVDTILRESTAMPEIDETKPTPTDEPVASDEPTATSSATVTPEPTNPAEPQPEPDSTNPAESQPSDIKEPADPAGPSETNGPPESSPAA